MTALEDSLNTPVEHAITTGDIKIGPEGGEFKGVALDSPIVDNDWSRVFRIFGLDPAAFEIVNDTVTIATRQSNWQQSARAKDGDRDIVNLKASKWVYSARFRRRSMDALPADIVQQWRKALLRFTPRPPPKSKATHGTYTTKVADPQIGKKRTEEAEANWRRGVNGHCAAIFYMIAAGRPPKALHVAFMGDEVEGVANNYTNQPHTVELNLSQQLEHAFDLMVWTLRQFAQFGIPMSASAVISNHGEWTRNGGKDPVTTQADNASTYLARQVKKLFDELEPHTGLHIDWTIGEGEPGVTLTLSGVECYFSHGYIEKGRGTSTESRVKGAIERQILGKIERLGTTKLWFMAHYHHFHAQEFEGRTLFGCPALEAERSSEYMLDQFGVWSPPGMLGMLVDSRVARGWTDLAIY